METEQAISLIFGLILAVGVSVTAIIFLSTISGSVFNTVESDINTLANNRISGDSFTALNNSAVRLDHSWIQTGTLRITNGSATGNNVGLGNFTINYDAGTVLLKTTATSSTYNASTMYANYTWGISEIRDSIGSSISSGFEAQEKTSKYLPITILAVVIGMVLMVLPFMGNRGGQNGSPL